MGNNWRKGDEVGDVVGVGRKAVGGGKGTRHGFLPGADGPGPGGP